MAVYVMRYYNEVTTQKTLKRQNLLLLMHTQNFTEDDLTATQNGYMSKRQRSELSQRRAFWQFLVWLMVIVVPFTIAATLWDGNRINNTMASRFGNCLLILALGELVLFKCLRTYQALNNDLQKGDITFEKGRVAFRDMGRNGAIMQIGKAQFVSYGFGDSFRGFKEGEIYRVFYTPFSKIILSAEWIGSNRIEKNQ